MDLVLKDLGLFTALAEQNGVPLELGPLVQRIFIDGQTRYRILDFGFWIFDC
jgi:3-hydroxyisobutyrate dehydrogenase